MKNYLILFGVFLAFILFSFSPANEIPELKPIKKANIIDEFLVDHAKVTMVNSPTIQYTQTGVDSQTISGFVRISSDINNRLSTGSDGALFASFTTDTTTLDSVSTGLYRFVNHIDDTTLIRLDAQYLPFNNIPSGAISNNVQGAMDSLFADKHVPATLTDSPTIDFSQTGEDNQTLTGSVLISQDTGNVIMYGSDGALYASGTGGGGGGGLASVNTTGGSLAGLGTSGSALTLLNDEASPGNSKYYGTNGSGTKGFFDLPSGSGGLTSVSTTHSITGDGDGTALSLVNDEASPGNTKLYGTNGAGVKGWYDQPAGGGSSDPYIYYELDSLNVVGKVDSVTYAKVAGQGTITVTSPAAIKQATLVIDLDDDADASDHFVIRITDSSGQTNNSITNLMLPNINVYDAGANEPPLNLQQAADVSHSNGSGTGTITHNLTWGTTANTLELTFDSSDFEAKERILVVMSF